MAKDTESRKTTSKKRGRRQGAPVICSCPDHIFNPDVPAFAAAANNGAIECVCAGTQPCKSVVRIRRVEITAEVIVRLAHVPHLVDNRVAGIIPVQGIGVGRFACFFKFADGRTRVQLFIWGICSMKIEAGKLEKAQKKQYFKHDNQSLFCELETPSLAERHEMARLMRCQQSGAGNGICSGFFARKVAPGCWEAYFLCRS